MAIADDIRQEVRDILKTRWTTRTGQVVPTPDSITLDNDAVILGATVLYADLAESTALVDGFKPWFAAEVYKCYLQCAARMVRHCEGTITAYDGDRIMGVFVGDKQTTLAAKCALHINWAVLDVINPAIKAEYPDSTYVMKQAVGIDTSSLFVAKIGVRGASDLVWVGPAANYAAKLCSLRQDDYASWITKRVFDTLKDEAKFTNGKPMWESMTWTSQNALPIYRSNWKWPV